LNFFDQIRFFVIVLRTFSKAYGLAGLRIGYVMGPERLVHALRVAGGPYAVSSLSIFLGTFPKGCFWHDGK